MTPANFERLRTALADRYPIVRQIGVGGMATVFLAKDPKHGREVAVKVLHQEMASTIGATRFLREIEIAARLTHPHVLPLFDSGEADGFLFYVMPHVDGESLRHRLTREPQLPLRDALRIAREVADALSYAHAHGVIHRDIKPENILIHAGHVLVADFGIARAMTVSSMESLTRAGVAIGTPAYMSPEQFGASPELDGRTDIYSLGCVLYEMLAGTLPHADPTPRGSASVPTVDDAAVAAIRPLVPPGVADIIITATATQPADRYPTADELVDELNVQVSLETDPTTAISRRARAARRRRWTITAALVVTAGLALLAGVRGRWVPGARQGGAVAAYRQITFVGNVAEASVSPDGSFLAYTTAGPDGGTLMVHDLESRATIQIAASPHPIVFPRWSPDGREILVGTGPPGGFQRVVYPRLGGDPYPLPVGAGALARWSVDGEQTYSWSTDGRRVTFASAATDARRHVPAADTTAWLHEVAQHPDGNTLAVLHVAREDQTQRLWRVDIDANAPPPGSSPTRRAPMSYELLLEDDTPLSSIEWAPDGRGLYYLRKDQNTHQLWRLRGAPGDATPQTPELLLSGLALPGTPLRPGVSLLSFSADAPRMYYVRGSTFSNLWTVRPRGEEWVVEPLTTGTATNFAASISPDGEWVAYNSTVAGRTNAFVVPARGGTPRQLTHGDSVSGYPVWDPEGRRVAFGLRRGRSNHVAVVNVTGPARLRVFESTALSGNGTITWAPGTDILYQRPDLRNFHYLDPETAAERPLWSADSAAVAFTLQARYSPDRSSLVVALNRAPRSTAGLYVVSLPDGHRRRLAPQPDLVPLGWSQNGDTVFALAEDSRGVLAIPTRGGPPTEVTSLPFVAGWVGATHQGRWFVLYAPDTAGDVWRIDHFDSQ